MTNGELFAGISGFGLGFQRAGIETLWRVEIDPNCQAVLRHHYPDDLLLSDVRECGKYNLPAVDVISFGSPCQDLSVAGKRGGLNGQRSGLFFEAIRICDELRPTFAVWENVPGALSSNAGRDFAAVLGSFRDIGARDIAWTVLDAQYFGLAQRRKRVFLVADFRGERAAEILFESPSLCRNPSPRREARARVAACLDGSPYANREAEDSRLIAATLDQRGRGPTDAVMMNLQLDSIPDVAWALQERDAKGADSDTKDGHLIIAASLTAGMSAMPGVNRPGRRREDDENLVCATLNSGGNSGGFWTEPGEHLVTHALSSEGADASEDGTGRGTPIVAFESRVARNGRGGPSEIVPPLKAESGQTGKGDSVPLAAGAFGVRRLAPTECERLQGFPDGWTEAQSDSARYRMLGNAVAVPVAAWIAKRIVEFAK